MSHTPEVRSEASPKKTYALLCDKLSDIDCEMQRLETERAQATLAFATRVVDRLWQENSAWFTPHCFGMACEQGTAEEHETEILRFFGRVVDRCVSKRALVLTLDPELIPADERRGIDQILQDLEDAFSSLLDIKTIWSGEMTDPVMIEFRTPRYLVASPAIPPEKGPINHSSSDE